MCGITGFFDYENKSSPEILGKMAASLEHRGPDDEGLFFENIVGCQVGLGHRRLAIQDLSRAGFQPMRYRDAIIIFNGEVYNFKEIREDLIGLGHTFNTGTDTEVILAAYTEWGIDFLDKLIGMFSFCLVDLRLKKAFLVRDRIGVKPLFYMKKDKSIFFSSEIKSLKKSPYFNGELDNYEVGHFFQFGFTGTNQSIFKRIQKLTPGAYIEIDLSDGQSYEKKFWSLTDLATSQTDDSLEVGDVESLLISACKYRMVSSTPVGVFLSGGVDSSLVTGILQKHSGNINTFTMGFENPKYDESSVASDIAKHLGTRHHKFMCSEKDALELVQKLPDIYDEPFADNSAIPTLLLSKQVSKYVKVVLSADGGDEVFCGYERYARIMKISKLPMVLSLPLSALRKLPLNHKIYNYSQRLEKIASILKTNNYALKTNIILSIFTPSELELLLDSYEVNGIARQYNVDPVNQMLLNDSENYLPNDILVKMDRASMAYSIEAREPLLDHRLFELSLKMSGRNKLKGGLKSLLKQVLYNYVPKELVDRPKKGFSIPIAEWLNGDLKELFLDLTSESVVKSHGVLSETEVSKIRSGFLRGEKINSHKLWTLLTFQIWMQSRNR